MESTQFDSVSEMISQEPETETFEETLSQGDLNTSFQEFFDLEVGAVSFIAFALGVVIGIIAYHILSRRWYA